MVLGTWGIPAMVTGRTNRPFPDQLLPMRGLMLGVYILRSVREHRQRTNARGRWKVAVRCREVSFRWFSIPEGKSVQ